MMKENDEAELISVYYGEDVTEEDAEAVVAKIEEKYPDTDVELQPGGQPIYYYLVSVDCTLSKKRQKCVPERRNNRDDSLQQGLP